MSWISLTTMGFGQMECFSPVQCYQLGLPDQETKHMFVFLHGLGDTAENFARASIVQTVWQSMEDGEAPSSLLLIPEGKRGYWVNWTDGEHLYEDWTLDTVLRIAKEYDIESISLVGVSMGGFGALSIGLRNSDLFDRIVAYSPTDMEIAIALRPQYQLYTSIFGEDVYKEYAWSLNPRELILRGAGHDQEIFWIVGDREPEKFLQGSVRLKAASEAQGLHPKIRIVPNGEHSFERTWNEESTTWWLKEIDWE